MLSKSTSSWKHSELPTQARINWSIIKDISKTPHRCHLTSQTFSQHERILAECDLEVKTSWLVYDPRHQNAIITMQSLLTYSVLKVKQAICATTNMFCLTDKSISMLKDVIQLRNQDELRSIRCRTIQKVENQAVRYLLEEKISWVTLIEFQVGVLGQLSRDRLTSITKTSRAMMHKLRPKQPPRRMEASSRWSLR